MSACTGRPISWLRLEQYALGELPAAERGAVAQHLAACAVCNECFASIEQAPPIALPDLQPPAQRSQPRRPRPKVLTLWPVWAGLASAAAVLLLFVRPAADPAARLHVKGGDFALEVVRLDANDQLQPATHFAPTDRFKVLLTCPPAWRGRAGVAVYQAGQTYAPLGVETIEACGNRRALTGAFQLDGAARALVCVSFAATEAEWRARVTGTRTPIRGSVCTPLEPASD